MSVKVQRPKFLSVFLITYLRPFTKNLRAFFQPCELFFKSLQLCFSFTAILSKTESFSLVFILCWFLWSLNWFFIRARIGTACGLWSPVSHPCESLSWIEPSFRPGEGRGYYRMPSNPDRSISTLTSPIRRLKWRSIYDNVVHGFGVFASLRSGS